MALTGTKTRGLIFLLFVAAVVYVAWNLIPPYYTNSQFQESLDDIVRRATYMQRITDEDVKDMVVHQAKSMDIPLNNDQVIVSRSGDGLGISVSYRVHVNLIVHPLDLDFTANSRNRHI